MWPARRTPSLLVSCSGFQNSADSAGAKFYNSIVSVEFDEISIKFIPKIQIPIGSKFWVSAEFLNIGHLFATALNQFIKLI
jgi:hypothetical protein